MDETTKNYERRIKKHILAKSFSAWALPAKGLGITCGYQAKSYLDQGSINADINEVRINETNFRSLIKLSLHLTTAREVYWTIFEGKCDREQKFEKLIASAPWSLIFPGSEIPVGVRVSSFKSKLYHEGRLRDIAIKALSTNGLIAEPFQKGSQRIWIKLNDNNISISIAMGGIPLYQRGFKKGLGHGAPLPEHLAASLTRQLMDYAPEESSHIKAIFNPFAGTGTLGFEAVIEQAHFTTNLWRPLGFQEWLCTPVKTVTHLERQAQQKAPVPIIFVEKDSELAEQLAHNCELFQQPLSTTIETKILNQDYSDVEIPRQNGSTMVPMNPPLGLRLPHEPALFRDIGVWISQQNTNIFGYLLASSKEKASTFINALGLGFSHQQKEVYHGGQLLEVIFFKGGKA